MKGLIDLLPEDVDDHLKKKYAKQLKKSRCSSYKPSKKCLKNVINSNLDNKQYYAKKDYLKDYEDDKNKYANKPKVKYIRLKKSVIIASRQKNKLKKIKAKEDAGKRERAKNGIIIYNHVFMNNSSFYGGRRRSLEWNDEVARHAKVGIRSLYKITKRKKR